MQGRGWRTHEEVYDIACSDGLKPDLSTHHCADNGAKVNLTDCSHSKDKGTMELNTAGRILNFKPADRAFYDVRVFENPSCRWSTYDAIKLKTNVPDGYPAEFTNVPGVLRSGMSQAPLK